MPVFVGATSSSIRATGRFRAVPAARAASGTGRAVPGVGAGRTTEQCQEVHQRRPVSGRCASMAGPRRRRPIPEVQGAGRGGGGVRLVISTPLRHRGRHRASVSYDTDCQSAMTQCQSTATRCQPAVTPNNSQTRRPAVSRRREMGSHAPALWKQGSYRWPTRHSDAVPRPANRTRREM